MKPRNLIDVIELNSYHVSIPLSKSKSEIEDILHQHGITTDTTRPEYYMIESTMLSLDIRFFIFFQFEGERLLSVSMEPQAYLEGSALHARYRIIQKALKNELGRPHNPWDGIMNLFNPDSQKNWWKVGQISIEHLLYDHFGPEEPIYIKLK